MSRARSASCLLSSGFARMAAVPCSIKPNADFSPAAQAGAHTAANSIHAVALWNILVARAERYRKLLTLRTPMRSRTSLFYRGLRAVFADYLGVCALTLNNKRPCRRQSTVRWALDRVSG